MLSKAIAFIICIFALLLPWRLRILFGELMGWIVQAIYFSYYGILNYLLSELRKGAEESGHEKK